MYETDLVENETLCLFSKTTQSIAWEHNLPNISILSSFCKSVLLSAQNAIQTLKNNHYTKVSTFFHAILT